MRSTRRRIRCAVVRGTRPGSQGPAGPGHHIHGTIIPRACDGSLGAPDKGLPFFVTGP